MKRYAYSDSFAAAYKRPPRIKLRPVAKEPVAKTLSGLDVMLSIWIAEAILDDVARLPLPSRRKARRRRTARVAGDDTPAPGAPVSTRRGSRAVE